MTAGVDSTASSALIERRYGKLTSYLKMGSSSVCRRSGGPFDVLTVRHLSLSLSGVEGRAVGEVERFTPPSMRRRVYPAISRRYFPPAKDLAA